MLFAVNPPRSPPDFDTVFQDFVGNAHRGADIVSLFTTDGDLHVIYGAPTPQSVSYFNAANDSI
jgi:hypothetical protein